MKKRLLSVFLCLCMVFGLVPATVWAETTTGHTHYLCGGSTCNGSGHENETYKTTFEKEIKQEGNTLKIGDKSWAPTKGSNDTFYILPTGTYYLGSDISPEYTIKIENNVTLCLNGHKITAADGMDAIYMTGGSFTLTDCKGVGTITHASSKTGRGVYVSSGTFNMYGGSITGNKAQDAKGRGGGVYVYSGSGTFNMYGGSITGNRATGDGGGVYKSGSNSSFNMYGGSITGNTANSYGGGVYVDGGGFTMSGGTIGGTKTGETNTATYGGGGVYAKANFEMTGGSITGNETNRGGGVYVTGKGSFTMSASADGQNIPSITGNNATENGGGVYVVGSSSTFKMTGGSIGGTNENDANTAYRGGGVCVDCSKFTMSASADGQNIPSITGNNATENGGGVYVIGSSSTFKMTGGTIGGTDANDANTATNGGGVCVSKNGSFEMSGSSCITNNKADSYGGGVNINYASATFTMKGGSITGNNAYKSDYISTFGGGVCVGSGTFTMTDGSITGNNAAYGGGVYTVNEFKMTGGSITGNNAYKSDYISTFGGGVCVGSGIFTVSGEVTVTDNTKGGTKGADGKFTGDTKNNVYLPTGKTITIGTDKLSEGAQLGVTVSGDYGDYPFTSGWNDNMSDKTPSDYFISDTDGYVAKLNGSELKMVTHVHNWTYTASGDTITATCKNCSNNNGNDFSGGSVTIQKPEKTKFNDGKDENAKVESVGWFGKAPSVAYAVKDGNALSAAPVNAGTYTAGITLGNVTVSVTYIIDKATQTAPTGLTTKGDIKNSGTGEIKNTAEDMEYNISANATTGWITCDNGSTRVAPATYYVRYKETDNYLASAVSVALTVKAHTHSGGNATCQKKAVCDGCGQEYGELGNHKFTETVSKMYLKSAATCQSPAVYYKSCLVCDEKSSETFEYGEKDFSNHIGNTYLVGQKEATCYAEGYTGDTYCSTCNHEIERGTSIAKNAHNPASVWTTDETDHWKECQTVGCGNIIDKAHHSGGEATCVNKAICEVCKIEYGDVDATNHKHTEVRGAKDATCCEKGYTGDTYCTDCNALISSGAEIPATGNHTDVDGKWESDGENHWHTCYFGTKFDVTAHTGGEATCVNKAICEVCKIEYGDVDATNHKNTEIRGATDPTCCEAGYTGDKWCTDCNTKIESGSEISSTGNHTDVDGKWESDGTNHWHTCYFGTKFDITAHNGGEATCKSPAECSECGHSYGPLDANNHKGTTYLKNQKEATCFEEGYTGDTYCSDCNEKIADGQSIAKNAHNPASVWTTNEHDHWKECQTVGCGNVIDKAAHSGGEATCVSKAVCEVCKAQYGDVDVANHKHTEIRDAKPATEQEKGYTGDTWCIDCNKKITTGSEIAMLEHKLTLVEAKDATVTEQGNIKYYYCENCGKYFADVAGAKEISLSETVIKKLPPEIIEGNNATVNNGEKKSLTFRCNAAFADFIRVELDGKTLDEKDYTKAEGSIIVTLNNNFVSTLSVGEHTLGIVSESGTATAKFTVKASEIPNESPKTGDDNMVAVWSFAAVLSLAVLGFTTVVSKKKRAK